MKVIATVAALFVIEWLGAGCASSYVTPGRGANMRALTAASADVQTDGSVVRAIAKRPLAQLPTAIAIVRVQESGYQSASTNSIGTGAYSVVTTKDIEGTDEVMQKLQKLPMVTRIAPLNRMLIPATLSSDLELRQAAAALHADMLLVYTLDTTFSVQDVAAPLSVVTLGLSPNQVANVLCTASAVLLDTRNGYVYGVAEATERQKQLASAWTSEAAVDATRRRTESKAFEKLAVELQSNWSGVVKNYNQAAPSPDVEAR